MHAQHVLAASMVASSVSASPLSPPSRELVARDGDTQTKVQVWDRKMNWGNAIPADVMSYLGKPGGPCTVDGACSTQIRLDDLPSTVVEPVWGTLSHEKFNVTVVDSQFENDDVRKALLNAIQAAVSVGTDARNTSYSSDGNSHPKCDFPPPGHSSKVKRDADADANPGGVSRHPEWADDPHNPAAGGCIMQNYQTSEINVQRLAPGQLPGWIHVSVDLVPPDAGHCEDWQNNMGKFQGAAAAMSALFPPFALVTGILGIIGDSCNHS